MQHFNFRKRCHFSFPSKLVKKGNFQTDLENMNTFLQNFVLFNNNYLVVGRNCDIVLRGFNIFVKDVSFDVILYITSKQQV